MTAREIIKVLGGRWSGSSGVAKCPAHPDKNPSLSISDGDDGRLLTNCHAGCAPEAVWDALRDRGLLAERSKVAPCDLAPGGTSAATSQHSSRSPPRTRLSLLNTWYAAETLAFPAGAEYRLPHVHDRPSPSLSTP